MNRVYTVSPPIIDANPWPKKWINEPEGLRAPGPFPLPSPNRMQVGSGFPTTLVRPVFQFDRADKRAPLLSAYQYSTYWLVAPFIKTKLAELDPSGFDWVEAETVFPDGRSGPPYWLGELVRYCDCFDKVASISAGASISERGVVSLGRGAPDANLFDKEKWRGSPFLRLPHNSLTELCSERTKLDLGEEVAERLHFFQVGWLV